MHIFRQHFICNTLNLKQMKKSLLTLLIALPFVVAAQLTMDDFESYNVGSFDSQWNASNWTGWFGGPSGSNISTEQALSGTKSVKIVTNNDLVALLGTLNTGTYEISFSQYIPSGSGAYFNMQHNYTNTTADWAAEVYFSDEITGQGQIFTNGTPTPFVISHDVWVENRLVFDFSADEANYYYDGSLVLTWQISTNAAGGPGLNQINGINFFGACLGAGCISTGYYDDVVVAFTPPALHDITIASFLPASEYTHVPVGHVQPFTFETTVANIGLEQVTSVEVTANVYDGTNTLVHSSSLGSMGTLAAGATAVFNTPATVYTPSVTDLYTIEYIASISEVDGNEFNNTESSFFTFAVTDSIYARDDGNYTDGIGAGIPAMIGQNFEVIIDDEVTAISMSYAGGAIGETIQGHLFSTLNGIPDALLSSTEVFTIATPGGLGAEVYVDLVFADPVALLPGTYAFVVEQQGSTNLLLSTSSNIFTAGSTVASLDAGSSWDNLDLLGFLVTLNVRPVFGGMPPVINTNNLNFDYEYSLSPNPTKGTTVLNLDLAGTHDVQLALYNLQGQLIFSTSDSKVSGELRYPLDLSGLADGVYLLKIKVDDQITSSRVSVVK
jgi:Secretion system C-terminal sorting domain